MKTLVLIGCLFLAQNVFAEDFESLFLSGNYSKALETLNQDESIQDRSYHLALCYARLQAFDKAIPLFEKAIEEKSLKKDLFYEYGQALYAANELTKARNAFETSAQMNFNPAPSLYYVGHISQILEDYKRAYKTYDKIIKQYPEDKKIKQISQFQQAETILFLMKDKNATNVGKHVLPLLKEGQNTDPTTSVAKDIDRRYHELLVEYQLDPDLLTNGRRISSRRWDATVSQRIKFDDNVTLSNFENNITQTKKESFLFDTEVYYKETFLLDKMFIIAPEARFTFTQYGDQTNSDVFQNDTYIFNFALKNKYEHKAFTRPASLIFDIDYTKTGKDSNKKHKRDPYSQAINFTLGESFTYFSAGDSTIKFKRKSYTGTDASINNYTYEMSVDQTLALSNQNLLIFMVNASMVDNYNNKTMNTNSILARIDYIIPEIFLHHTLDVALGETVTDTKLQNATRGTETSLNPSLDLSREINQNTKISANVDVTFNKSKSSDYTYQKNVISMEFKYVF